MNSRSPEVNLGADLRKRLRQALDDAMLARDKVAASARRSALGAIGNAEAVHPGPAQAAAASTPHLAGTVAGLGAGEAQRPSLSEAEAGEVVRLEVTERQLAASEYERAGHADGADRLRREALVLQLAADGKVEDC